MSWEEEFKKNLIKVLYDPNQPRDKDGKWTSGGSGGKASGNVTTTKEALIDDFQKTATLLKVDFSPQVLWSAFEFQYNNFATKAQKRKVRVEDFVTQKMNDVLEIMRSHYSVEGGGRWRMKEEKKKLGSYGDEAVAT